MRREVRTTCSRDCPDSCGVIATVEDGRIVGHRGDPDHGVTRGFLCRRGNRYLERFYHPDRLLYPLKRTAGGHVRVTWDEALDLLAAKLEQHRAAVGPTGVVGLSYSAIHSWVARVAWRLFWAHFGGATLAAGGLSVEPLHAAQALDFGGDCTHDPADLEHAAAFVLFGKNLAVTRPHWVPFVQTARRRGAPLHVVDVLRTATARTADAFYQLRPGSDGLLALGIARLLLDRGALDERFIADHTVGFEAYRALLLRHDPGDVAVACDLTLAQLEQLAEVYASRRPVATMVGLGPGYWAHGAAQVRLIDALAAVTGNVGRSGGGVQTDLTGDPGLDLAVLRDGPRPPYRRVLLPRLGADLEVLTDPAPGMALVVGANPVATAPDGGRTARALRALDFVAVVDQFMSATAALADLVLPCTTYLEARDLVTAYGHNWVGLTNEVVPPRGEARPDWAILQALAARLGFGAALPRDPDACLRQLVAPWAAAGVTLEALEAGPRRRPGAADVAFADRRFGTRSGKVELIGEYAAAPAPLGPGELHLVATKTVDMVNSQINPGDLPAEPVARLHPETLAARGLAPDALVWLASAAGRVQARAAADASLRRDVALLNPARWSGDLLGVNQLRVAVVTDLGDGAALHETRVTVTPA